MEFTVIENKGKTNMSGGWPQTKPTREQESVL